MSETAAAGSGANPDGQALLSNIIQALDLIHARSSTNELRQQALEFLETQKNENSAAHNGYFLASQKNNSPVIRHFGLSLIEHVLRHRSANLPAAQLGHLRGLILDLSQGIEPQDPPYIRNKIAILWVEIAKRTWGLDWLGMDESLVQLWNATITHKEFVLSILETLSDDVIHHEDTTSSLRGTDLNRALVEICTPFSVFKEEYEYELREHVQLRCGEEGWLFRISRFLDECRSRALGSAEVKSASLKALATLRSLMIWSIPLGISSSQCVPTIFQILTLQDEDILLAAVEALHSLYGRTNYNIHQFEALVVNMLFQKDNIFLLRRLYEWSIVEPSNLPDLKYDISKKLSELVSYAAGFIEEDNFDFKDVDTGYFFQFLTDVLRHPSLTVSIPALHSFSGLLQSDRISQQDGLDNLMAPLLEICTQRLVRYESLPEETEDPAVIFLNEDIDTLPERHSFVGNYRRYCGQVIEMIVKKKPHDAIPYILSRVDFALNNVYSGLAPFDPATFKKYTVPLLRADTQFTVVEATLKGYSKWVDSLGENPQEDEQQRLILENSLESWALSLMGRNFEDPIMKERVIRLSVDFSARALSNKPSFALKVLEHILMTNAAEHPEFPLYSEAVRELHSLTTYEVRRLAIRYSDYFASFYDVLEMKIKEIMDEPHSDDRPRKDLSAVLLIVMQRAKDVDPYVRQSRLQAFIEPMKQAWANEEFKQLSSSFEGFCQLLALDKVRHYLQNHQVHKIEDWSTITLDEEGKQLQSEMSAKFQQLPLRGTKTMFAVTTEKVQKTDDAYQIACDLWRDMIPLVLPTLLQLVSHAHAFHDPQNWSQLPEEMCPVVGRILMDRFWQAGISTGSREEFYARIAISRATLEGFSSSVRGKVRAVREACYSLLYSMSRLGDHLYSYEELSVPLSQALYKDATALSSHQFSVLLNVSRWLIDDCPPQFRGHFLPPMLSTLFTQLDKKITSEWDIIERRKAGIVEGDLTEEMKDESVLRQLTYSAVLMVANLLDPHRTDKDTAQNHQGDNGNKPTTSDSIRSFVLSSPQILESVILFSTHVIRMHDTRCCSVITRVIRSILEAFVLPVDTPTAATIREFISTDILKACITSVHEPYFVDMQKDLAGLIASIWILYGPMSNTTRSIILSLPGLTEAKVAGTEEALMRSTSSRQQRALVLDLLDGLRGVSISEQGRISGSRDERRKARSAMQARYMTSEMEGQEGSKVDVNNGPDLTGVADMFS